MGEVNDVLMDYLRDNTRFADLFNGTLFGGESVIRAEELFEGSEVSVEGLSREGARKAAVEGLLREETRKAAWPEDGGSGEDSGRSGEDSGGGGKDSGRSGKGFGRNGKGAGKTILRIRDIKKWMRSGCGLRILAAENQDQVDYAFPWRGMNYDGLQYEEQIRRLRRENRREGRLGSSAERMCGLRREDRLVPVFTLCLYHGEEPWDGPRSLKDMMDFGRERERWEKLFSDYRIHLVCLNEMRDFGCFKSPLKDLFGLVPYRKDKQGLKKYLEGNAVYHSLDEETARAASVLMGMKNFEKNKKKYQEGEGYDMCTALRELVEDGIEQGKREEKQLCYLRAIAMHMAPEDARAVAGISEKEAKMALRLREQGKI